MKRVPAVLADVVKCVHVSIIHIEESVSREFYRPMCSGTPFFYSSIKLCDILDNVQY